MPLAGRGAGTSIAGNALSTGLVLDTSRYLNRVLSVDPERRTAVVQPGAVLDSVTQAAAPFGLRFGPDPSTHSRATVGGAIGNNACGSRALRYGRSADNVVALDVLTGTGVRFTAGRYGKDEPLPAAPEAALLAGLRALVGRRPGHHQDRVRPVHQAGVRLLRLSTCCRRTGSTWPSSSPAPRGRWR